MKDVDWAELARDQGPLEHLEPCNCTVHVPTGFVIEHDCGRALEERRRAEERRLTRIACFFCGDVVSFQDAKLTEYGRVYGPCCADLGDEIKWFRR